MDFDFWPRCTLRICVEKQIEILKNILHYSHISRVRQKPVGEVMQMVSPTLPFTLSLLSPFPFPYILSLTSGREGQIQYTRPDSLIDFGAI